MSQARLPATGAGEIPTVWYVAVVLFVAGDTVTTDLGMEAGYTEDNPVASELMDAGDTEALLGAKVAVTIAAFAVYQYLRSHGHSYAKAIPWLMVGLGGLATVSNGAALAGLIQAR